VAAKQAIAAGRTALQAGRWADARAAFESALADEESADALDGLALALWWLGETRASVDLYQRAYARFRRDGDRRRAGLTAIWLCITYRSSFGNYAASGGWIARAERLLEGSAPDALLGWLLYTRAYDTTDAALARDLNGRALEIARRTGDPDLELCALCQDGRALVALGQYEAGLRLIDEAMAGTLAGERRRLDTVVFTCCDMLTACDIAGDVERAARWCAVADGFIRRYGSRRRSA
jgi:tetratricopeptide (TPR) repeat protein